LLIVYCLWLLIAVMLLLIRIIFASFLFARERPYSSVFVVIFISFTKPGRAFPVWFNDFFLSS